MIEQRWIKEVGHQPAAGVAGARDRPGRANSFCRTPQTPEESLPRPAIRPYPARYVSPWITKNGMKVIDCGPIRPEDEPAMARFHETLSDRSVYLRFFHMEN